MVVVMVNFNASRFASATGVPWYVWQELAGQRPGMHRDVEPAVSSMIGGAGPVLPRLAAATWGTRSSRELMSL